MLRSFGETRINSLSGTLPIDAAEAKETLTEVLLDIQTEGWHWNTEYFTLTPDTDGFITLPTNVLSVDAVDGHEGLLVTQRNGKLYNLTPFKSGDKWTDYTDGVDLELVLGLAYEDIPATAKKYVYYKAARIFVARQEGDQLTLNTASTEENLALAAMRREENRARPRNIRNNASIQQILARGVDHHHNAYGQRQALRRRVR